MSITLFEISHARSARVRWTLIELDIPFDSVEGRHLWGSKELLGVHPLGKVPAIVADGQPLFESAAICNWLADSHPDKGFIAKPGTWQRALHDQWVTFTLAEIEAHMWSTARNRFLYPEADRVPEILSQNKREALRALKVLDDYLAEKTYLIDERFSVTDIFVGYAVHWAEAAKLIGDFGSLRRYNEQLLSLPNCSFTLK